MTKKHIYGMGLLALFSGACVAEPLGNTTITSFNTAKKIMQQHVYTTPELRKTLYCGATFNVKKEVTPPSGFKTNKYKNRLNRWEAEHIVPAENFGRTFIEWREGHPQCID
ncbi:endonuclease I, partial [Vibrio parahaemolyticus]|nr:endonuclease I [Vibrio parahaemolyticus]